MNLSKLKNSSAAPPPRPTGAPNYIGCAGRDPVVISLYLNYEMRGWIEYNRHQLDSLITLLQAKRAAMDEKTPE